MEYRRCNFLSCHGLAFLVSTTVVLLWSALAAQASYTVPEKDKFTPAVLKCLVCQKMIDEFEWAFSKTDPNKKIEVGKSFTLNANGEREKKVVSIR